MTTYCNVSDITDKIIPNAGNRRGTNDIDEYASTGSVSDGMILLAYRITY